jgi:cellulose synthase/poly-beta-1,6-N-acetylglucosamine synthase-like glycosyltransferase
MSGKTFSAQLLILLFVLALVAILIGKLIINDHEHDSFLYSYGILVTAGVITLLTVRYLWYKDPYETAQKLFQEHPELKDKKPFVSIMVAAFNEMDFVDTCVNSLIAQTYTDREIIIVNDASTDGTRDTLDRYRNMSGVQVLNLKQNVGKKMALAQAMLRAKGSVFIFTDSDSVLAADAVERVVDIFTAYPRIGAISGHTRAYNAKSNLLTHIQDTWYEGQFSIRKAYESVFGAVTCVSGPLAAFRREAVFNLIPAWINDMFLGSEFRFATDRTKTALVLSHRLATPRIRSQYPHSPFVVREYHPPQDWNVVYTKSAHAWTNVPESIQSFLKQQIRWKKSFLRNILLTGKFYWRRPFLAAAMYYMRAIFVFVGPFIVFRHLVWLPMSGDVYSGVLYLSGILFLGLTFATLHKIEHPNENVWIYRPLMNLISTFMLSWLIFYSILTIRKMTWSRG